MNPTNRKRVSALVAGAVFGLLLAGCPHPQVPDDPAAEVLGPGPLLPPDSIGFDFMWRQHVTAEWPDGTESFDAVLQTTPDGLLQLVGLGPMDRPAFLITQTRDGIEFENLSGREVPFDAAYMIADVQRVFFPWLGERDPGSGASREGRVGVLAIEETFAEGNLRVRRFDRDDAPDRPPAIVTYDGWVDGLDAPGRAVLDNGWFGYRLTVDTVEQVRVSFDAERW